MRAIIVEDEFPARKELRYFIENKSSIEVVNEFTNGIEVLDFIQENKIDVIFGYKYTSSRWNASCKNIKSV